MALPVSLDRRVQGLLLVAALWDLSLKSILSNRMKSTQQTLRNQLRQQIRKTRANLTALQQQQAEDSITQQALALIEERNAQHIALYVSFDGEISQRNLSKPFGHKISTFICRYYTLSIRIIFCFYVICQIHRC